MTISAYNSDARQLQDVSNLQQLRLRNMIAEENITDVLKGLVTLINNI